MRNFLFFASVCCFCGCLNSVADKLENKVLRVVGNNDGNDKLWDAYFGIPYSTLFGEGGIDLKITKKNGSVEVNAEDFTDFIKQGMQRLSKFPLADSGQDWFLRAVFCVKDNHLDKKIYTNWATTMTKDQLKEHAKNFVEKKLKANKELWLLLEIKLTDICEVRVNGVKVEESNLSTLCILDFDLNGIVWSLNLDNQCKIINEDEGTKYKIPYGACDVKGVNVSIKSRTNPNDEYKIPFAETSPSPTNPKVEIVRSMFYYLLREKEVTKKGKSKYMYIGEDNKFNNDYYIDISVSKDVKIEKVLTEEERRQLEEEEMKRYGKGKYAKRNGINSGGGNENECCSCCGCCQCCKR